MTNSVTFDDFNQKELGKKLQDPYQFMKFKTQDNVHEWLFTELDSRVKNSESRMRYYRRNLALFKGIHYKNMDSRNDNRDEQNDNIRKPKMVINFIQEMLLAKVAKNALKRPALAMIPNDDSGFSKNNIRGIKALIDNRYERVDIDDIYVQSDTVRYLLGESYVFVEWNEDLGAERAEYRRLVSEAKKRGIPLKSIKLKNGKNAYNHRPMTGDTDYVVRGPDVVLPQLDRKKWKDVDDIMVVEWVDTEKVRHEYPKLADKINSEDGALVYDAEILEVRPAVNQVQVITYYHRKTKYLPQGKMIKFTPSVLLEQSDLPYGHGKLPCSRLTDIDVYGELHSRSFIQNILQLQRHFNNITSGVARNHGIGSAPKWMMPKGACSVADLNNEFTIVEYKGNVAPKIVTHNTTSPEIYNYQDKLERWIEKGSIVPGISRGQPPAGVTASVAMQYIDEQENMRDNINVAKRYSHIKEIFMLTAQTMEDYYNEDDERVSRILGSDNEYIIRSMKSVDFSVLYDVKVQNVSSLPDSKAGRIQSIIDLNNSTNTSEEGPVFGRGEIVDMIGLGLDDSFKSKISAGVKSAESVIDSIVIGSDVREPDIFDSFEDQYPIFIRALQERSFKDVLDVSIQTKLIQYIKTMEGLMWERSMKNMLFASWLQTRSDFPLFFQPPMPPLIQPPTDGKQVMDMSEINQESLSGQEGPQKTK